MKQELEVSTWQVEELCHEHDEAKQLQYANVARMTELEGKNRCLLEQEVDLQKQCEHQELDKYRALNIQCQK